MFIYFGKYITQYRYTDEMLQTQVLRFYGLYSGIGRQHVPIGNASSLSARLTVDCLGQILADRWTYNRQMDGRTHVHQRET